MPYGMRSRAPAVDPPECEDVIMGSTFGEGTTGGNVARAIALRAGLPVTTAGLSINRFCSSGLQAIALAAHRIMAEEASVMVAGGLESIFCVQNEANTHMRADPWILEHKPTLYWSMLQTRKRRSSATKSPGRRRTSMAWSTI
jgi:acetyl-CoA C-acetyltransferase